MKVLSEHYAAHSLKLTLAAPGGSLEHMDIRKNAARASIQAAGAILNMQESAPGTLQITFPPSDGYVQKEATLTWK
jgi:hypothetical protein